MHKSAAAHACRRDRSPRMPLKNMWKTPIDVASVCIYRNDGEGEEHPERPSRPTQCADATPPVNLSVHTEASAATGVTRAASRMGAAEATSVRTAVAITIATSCGHGSAGAIRPTGPTSTSNETEPSTD